MYELKHVIRIGSLSMLSYISFLTFWYYLIGYNHISLLDYILYTKSDNYEYLFRYDIPYYFALVVALIIFITNKK